MFITFEGIEGVGKTTQLKAMAEMFKQAGLLVLMTREPGGTPMGEEIRNVLLVHRYERVAPLTELLLMFAARAQHVDTVIRPALAQGRIVLCDRFVDATYAYQGGGRGVSFDLIRRLELLVLGDFKPDLTLLFDAPVEIGLNRIKARDPVQDRIEQEKLDFFERVRVAYLSCVEVDPKRYRIIDASQSLETVQQGVSQIATEIIQNFHAH